MDGSGVGKARVWLARLGIVLAAAVLLGRLGPFGTFADLAPVARYSYWVGLTLLMWLQGVAALALMDAVAGRLNVVLKIMLSAILAAVPTAFEVAWAEMLLRVERDLGATDILQILGDVCLLSVPLLLATQLVVKGRASGTRIERQEAPDADWLLARIEPQRRGRLLAVQSEDHYVRVLTSGGSQLVHMRFGDAVAKLGSDIGCQVHRSWWVAKEAVRSQKREGDRIIVELIDGTKVPVSRSFAMAARQSGLIGA